MNKPIFFLTTAIALYGLYRMATKPALKHFSPSEFGTWWPMMSNDVLLKLDAFREAWGYPVVISPAAGGLGRVMSDSAESMHNVTRWGEVRAADIFPKVPDGRGGYRYMQTQAERIRAYQVAKQVGFTGIGLYTDTMPGNMLHVDNRDTDNNYVATWSRVDGQYLGIGAVA